MAVTIKILRPITLMSFVFVCVISSKDKLKAGSPAPTCAECQERLAIMCQTAMMQKTYTQWQGEVASLPGNVTSGKSTFTDNPIPQFALSNTSCSGSGNSLSCGGTCTLSWAPSTSASYTYSFSTSVSVPSWVPPEATPKKQEQEQHHH